jgi:hypothetical protein
VRLPQPSVNLPDFAPQETMTATPNHPLQRTAAGRRQPNYFHTQASNEVHKEKRNKCRRPSEASYAGFTVARSCTLWHSAPQT